MCAKYIGRCIKLDAFHSIGASQEPGYKIEAKLYLLCEQICAAMAAGRGQGLPHFSSPSVPSSTALPHVTLPLSEVISRARSALPAAELGSLTASLASAVGCARGSRALLFLVTFGLWSRLHDGEFVEGFGAHRLPAARLLRLASASCDSPAMAVRTMLSLHSAGALDAADLAAPRALAAMHGIISAWWSDAHGGAAGEAAVTAAAARFLVGLVSDMDSFANAGAFLASFFNDTACKLPRAAVRLILTDVCSNEDVHDLAGSPRALIDALPAHAAAISEALAAAADDSDADEDGNLAGFVADDIVYDTTDGSNSGSSEADCVSESGDSASSSSGSGDEAGSSPPIVTSHKRRRLESQKASHSQSSRWVDLEARR